MQIFFYIYADPASINFFVCLRLPSNTFFQLHTALKVIHIVLSQSVALQHDGLVPAVKLPF